MPLARTLDHLSLFLGMVLVAALAHPGRGSETSVDPGYMVGKFKEASQWTRSTAMNVDSETLVAGGGNPGHRRQKTVYRRDGDRLEVITQDCLLGRMGTLSGGEQLTETDFNREMTDATMYLLNDDCSMIAVMFAGGTRYSATTRRQDYRRDFDRYYSILTSGDFLQGTFSVGDGTSHIADALAAAKDLQVRTEDMRGVSCYVIDAKLPPYGSVTAWIVPDKGFNCMKYIVRKSGADLIEPGRPIAAIGLATWTVTVDPIEVAEIEGVFVPVGGRYVHESVLVDGTVETVGVRITRSNVQINPDFEAMGAFRINLPEGTPIRIAEAPGIRYVWRNGQVIVDTNDLLFDVIDKMDVDLTAMEEPQGLSASSDTRSLAAKENRQASGQVFVLPRHDDDQSSTTSGARKWPWVLICAALLIGGAWAGMRLRRSGGKHAKQ